MWTGKIIFLCFHELKQQYYYIINIVIQELREEFRPSSEVKTKYH